MSTVTPISALGRPPEQGRLRFGVKTEKAMKALDKWRFTSTDQEALGILAEQYGGTPRPWNEPKAAVQGQWELLSDAPSIDVLLPEDALHTAYEFWQGSGCQRRCDGEICTIPTTSPDGDLAEVPCLCARDDLMKCRPKVRLSVVLPGVPFRGVWRMESGSWNAAHELAAMEPLVQAMQGRGILRAQLVLERRSKIKDGKKSNFIVPKLVLAATPEELASGQAGLPGIPVVQREIGAGEGDRDDGRLRDTAYATTVGHSEATAASSPDPSLEDEDDIVDGEIIEPRTRAEVKTELLLLFDSNVEECAQAWAYANGDEMEWDSGTARTIYDRWNGRPM